MRHGLQRLYRAWCKWMLWHHHSLQELAEWCTGWLQVWSKFITSGPDSFCKSKLPFPWEHLWHLFTQQDTCDRMHIMVLLITVKTNRSLFSWSCLGSWQYCDWPQLLLLFQWQLQGPFILLAICCLLCSCCFRQLLQSLRCSLFR